MTTDTPPPAQPSGEFFDKPPVELGQDDVVCLFTCYNEADRLPYFLEYYRSIGINKFFAVDNNSTDSTADILKSAPDVTYFFTEEDYGTNRSGINWTDEIANHYGMGRWCLTVDVDELFMFPGSDICSIQTLTKYMDERNQRVLFTVFLDMYGAKDLDQSSYQSGTPFLETSEYFETHSYRLERAKNFPPVDISGGPRRVFFEGRKTPSMRKCPLVKRGPDSCYIYSTHALFNIPLSDVVGTTLHFKLFGDFAARVAEEVERNSRYLDKEDFKCYDTGAKRGRIAFRNDQSHKYKDNTQFVELGVMTCSKDFVSFLAENIEAEMGREEAEKYSASLSKAVNRSMTQGLLELRHLPQIWAMLTKNYENPIHATTGDISEASPPEPNTGHVVDQTQTQLRALQAVLKQRDGELRNAKVQLRNRTAELEAKKDALQTAKNRLTSFRQEVKDSHKQRERIEASFAWRLIRKFVK